MPFGIEAETLIINATLYGLEKRGINMRKKITI